MRTNNVKMSAGRRKGSSSRTKRGEGGGEAAREEEDPPSLFSEVFSQYKAQLDSRHDRHERLVKLSRDTTIHSKRVIFLLHRAAGEEGEEREGRLQEAEGKLREVGEFLRAIAEELLGVDPWLHTSAFSPGLQEFVEALSYYVYLRRGQLVGLNEAQSWLEFPEQEGGGAGVRVPLSQLNYVLGVGDLTGELMRMCITAVGAGQQEIPLQLLPFITSIYCGFQSLPHIARDISQKLRTMRSSVAKIETACYTLQIRGSEIPRHMLGDVFQSAASRDTELSEFD